MRKTIRFTRNVDYGGLIKKGTQGWIDEEAQILSIRKKDYGGPAIGFADNVEFGWPKSFIPELLPMYSAIEVISETKKGSSMNSDIRNAIETLLGAGFSVRKEMAHQTFWIDMRPSMPNSTIPNPPIYYLYREEGDSLTAPQFDNLDEAIENLLDELPYGLVKKLLNEEAMVME